MLATTQLTSPPVNPATSTLASAPLSAAPDAIFWADQKRADDFFVWLERLVLSYDLQPSTLRLASADASFRRYFRIEDGKAHSYIIMDAPPDKENSKPFVRIARLMGLAGLIVPKIIDWQAANGFMLLTDLGTRTMLDAIDPLADYAHTSSTLNANLPLYDAAIEALIALQKASQPDVLPPYDEARLLQELQLFPTWYVARHRQITLNAQEQNVLDQAFAQIIAHNLASPCVWVHRDFMPRNLMMPYPHVLEKATPPQTLGVLDFQDAVYGPITYDIASLMRDAFLSWEEDFVLDVTVRYWQKAKDAKLPLLPHWQHDFGAFYKAVEWMGLQRHLKILGIFARLTLRDGKPKYLADTPRFIAYVRATCSRYTELKPLLRLIDRIETEAI